MTWQVDHVIFCLSQPSLSAKATREMLASLCQAGSAVGCPVQAIRLEGDWPGLPDALRAARDAGARTVRVQPLGFPMAASILAWLPGAVAHWQAGEGAGVQVWLGDPPEAGAILPVMVAAALAGPDARPADIARPSLGKPGWQHLPDHDTHILVCTGPRCAFRGAGTLTARLKAMLAEKGLSDRCLTTTTGCLFPCNQGPLLALYPRNQWFVIPDEDALRAIVCEVIGKGGDLPHLRLDRRPARKVAS
jgi:(2Fe-2S) ferredoxin